MRMLNHQLLILKF